VSSLKVIIYLGLLSFLSLFACVQNDAEVRAKAQVTYKTQSPNGKKTVRFGQTPSPLQSTELVLQNLPTTVVSAVLSGTEPTPSNQSVLEQAIAVGNLLRSPCLYEWGRGQTLNQSLVEGQCIKSIEWMRSVYSSILDGESLDDVLFKMVAPGPYDVEMEEEANTVVISLKMLQLEMLHERVLHIETLSGHPVTIIVITENKSFNLNRECLNNGHKLSVDIDRDRCFKDTISTETASIIQRDSNISKPVWYLNGYRFSGFQSTKQLSYTLSLP
jgi:hypothetical protein